MRINWARKRWWEVNKPISKRTRESLLRPARHSAQSSQRGLSLPQDHSSCHCLENAENAQALLWLSLMLLSWLNLPLINLSIHILLTCFKRWSSGRRVGAINSSLVCSYHWVPFTNRRVTVYYTVRGKVWKPLTTACFPFPAGCRQTVNSLNPLWYSSLTGYHLLCLAEPAPPPRAPSPHFSCSSAAPLPLQEASGLRHTVFSARNVPGSAGKPQSRHRVCRDGLPTARSVGKSTCQLPPAPHKPPNISGYSDWILAWLFNDRHSLRKMTVTSTLYPRT